MHRVTFLLFLTFITLLIHVKASGYDSVISHLSAFQDMSEGGFRLSATHEPSLEATSHALFLSSLYGLKNKISHSRISDFIASLKKKDLGYSSAYSQRTSDLASIRYAILSYNHLGTAVPDREELARLIHSFYDQETKLFANRLGDKGDLVATAHALESLSLLGATEEGALEGKKADIRFMLNQFIRNGEEGSHFDVSNLSPLSATYYGIIVAKYVDMVAGEKFDPAAFARWIRSKQTYSAPNKGGFFSGLETSVESTSHAIASLALLSSMTGKDEMDGVHFSNLHSFLRDIPHELGDAARAHFAMALTPVFPHTLQIDTRYDLLDSRLPVPDKKRIVQGTQFKPVFLVRSPSGVPHAGLDVTARTTYEDEVIEDKLVWKDNEGGYVGGKIFDTKDKLGEMRIVYEGSSLIPELDLVDAGEVKIVKEEVKSIGYNIKVDAEARMAGKKILKGDFVGFGTTFNFGVTLSTQAEKNLLSGDFSVLFSVLDSSEVVIDKEMKNCRDNADPIHFSFTLESRDIPGGHIIFRFDVQDKGAAHTSTAILYRLSIPMIATDVSINQREFKIGDEVDVKMKPASLVDLEEPVHYKSEGKESREFVMDVSSPTSVIRSITGQVGESGVYTFHLTIPPHFDSIGTNFLSFRYVPKNAQDDRRSHIPLKLYDEREGFNYTVNARLHAVEIDKEVKGGDLSYGNKIGFNFKVKDAESGKYVWSSSQSTVILSLRHHDERRNREYTSDETEASEVRKAGKPDHFHIDWEVNPNAVKGAGSIHLHSIGADGEEILLRKEGSNDPWVLPVKIGGKIDVAHTFHIDYESVEDKVAFLIPFSLSSHERYLTGAQLTASLYRTEDGELVEVRPSLPVIRAQDGSYAVSWIADIKEAIPGDYVVHFYREVDRSRAAEEREAVEKELLRKETQARREGKSEEELQKERNKRMAAVRVEPLFEVNFGHWDVSGWEFPVRTESMVAGLLLALLVGLGLKKLEMQPAPMKVKTK